MRDVVVDASVVLKWIRPEREERVAEANAVLADFEAGRLRLMAPTLLRLELLNIAGRKWRWPEAQLHDLLAAVTAARVAALEPDFAAVARWTAAGLTAYDAAYVAVAEQVGATLITDDGGIVACAPGVARALADVEASG